VFDNEPRLIYSSLIYRSN